MNYPYRIYLIIDAKDVEAGNALGYQMGNGGLLFTTPLKHIMGTSAYGASTVATDEMLQLIIGSKLPSLKYLAYNQYSGVQVASNIPNFPELFVIDDTIPEGEGVPLIAIPEAAVVVEHADLMETVLDSQNLSFNVTE